MKEQTVIGAGLSGMVAAITLARKGYEVTVRERRTSPGGPITSGDLKGMTLMAGDGTAMDLEAMERYIGIDLSPVAMPLPTTTVHAYGKTFEIVPAPNVGCYLFERGPHPSSLDNYLYGIAQEEGVQFSFEDVLLDKGISELPPKTIIATGLFSEAMQALGIPAFPLYGYIASEETDKQDTFVIFYFDEFTRDYAFYMRVSGIQAAVLFQREWPLPTGAAERFQEALRNNDGIEFEEWRAVDIGSIPLTRFRSPQLFLGDYILSGTLAGAQDPFLLFGVHGALLTGKVSALAVEEPAIAEREFKRINLFYPLYFIISYLYRYSPRWLVKRMLWLGWSLYPYIAEPLGEKFWIFVPGFGRM